MLRPLLAVLVAATLSAPLGAQSAAPLTDLQITSVTSAAQAERIGAGQPQTLRHHIGPVTIVLRETGIGATRVLRIDGRLITPPSSSRPLCGPAITAGACRPGAMLTGLEITYNLDAMAAGETLSIQSASATLPAQRLMVALTFG